MSQSALFDLHGLRAAVLGGTGVLGSRFATCLAEAGADVMVLGRSEARGTRVADDIVSAGGSATFVPVDVLERDSIQNAAEYSSARGGLHILVNAVGVNSMTPFAHLSDEEWGSLLDVNLSATFRACQLFAPQMSGQPGGASIINISSASSGPPLSRVLGYGVAKAGLNSLTQYLARELAPDGVRVNALVPGFFPAEQNRVVLTPERVESILRHTPLGRLGEPSELEGALVWLASPRASGFVTGALIHVDGGFSAMTI